MRYFLHLAYNGTNYCGWQIQPNAPSVQETLEHCLSLRLHEEISVVGCGRTDTGVHARSFYAHFESQNVTNDLKDFVDKLNLFLPDDIVIFDCFPVAPDHHARFSATSRTYHYYITQKKDPFHTHDAFYLYGDLDINLMNQAAQMFLTTTDFTSFSKLHTQVKTNNCKVSRAFWSYQGSLLVFEITADRFLRNMVRAIVGTLLDVGRHRLSLNDFQDIINKKNRCSAGTSVPAHALFLDDVTYI